MGGKNKNSIEEQYKKLTLKQRKFIDYYIETGSVSQAAKLAGYKGKNLYALGSENYRKLKVFIDEKLKHKDAKRIANQDEVLELLTSAMRGEIKEEVVSIIKRDDGSSEIVKAEKKVVPKDRIRAAELLGKRYNLFTDKLDVEITQIPQIVDDIK